MGGKSWGFLRGAADRGTCFRGLAPSLQHPHDEGCGSHRAVAPALAASSSPGSPPGSTRGGCLCPAPLLPPWRGLTTVGLSPSVELLIFSAEMRVSLCMPSRAVCKVRDITNRTRWSKSSSRKTSVILKEIIASLPSRTATAFRFVTQSQMPVFPFYLFSVLSSCMIK